MNDAQGEWRCRAGCRTFRAELNDTRQLFECSECRRPVYYQPAEDQKGADPP
jgi:hypothetical protein